VPINKIGEGPRNSYSHFTSFSAISISIMAHLATCLAVAGLFLSNAIEGHSPARVEAQVPVPSQTGYRFGGDYYGYETNGTKFGRGRYYDHYVQYGDYEERDTGRFCMYHVFTRH
jgi:hypothetical protein